MRKAERTRRTPSGLYVRSDLDIGLLAYNPSTGLTYAVHSSIAAQAMAWLEGSGPAPSTLLESALSRGAPRHDVVFGESHLFPVPGAWDQVIASEPILINWFVTGRCPLQCTYCYAEDLMRGRKGEPDVGALMATARSILSLKPLIVVLTGGDALFGPNIFAAIESLSGRVGLIVDTSGYTLTKKHIAFFREHDVAVRISFDTERPALNQALRPLHPDMTRASVQREGTLAAAVKALNSCLDNGITVTVQSVATKATVNDLPALGDKLFRLGVKSWRVFKVSPAAPNAAKYATLLGSRDGAQRTRSDSAVSGMYRHNFAEILKRSSSSWGGQLTVQVTDTETVNSVILVGPDGVFYTEATTESRKAIIDPLNPRQPTRERVRHAVNMQGHTARYLNLTSRPFREKR